MAQKQVNSIKFWINAFIPQHIPGYTIRVPAGPHKGKTMIPGPGATNVRIDVKRVPVSGNDMVRAFSQQPHHRRTARVLTANAVGVSDCYLTDMRTFSNYIQAKSRMHSEFRLDFSHTHARMTDYHRCWPTTECDCEDGIVECDEEGKINKMKFELLPQPAASSNAVFVVKMDCAANNPCSFTSRFFGDIDYEGTITIDLRERSLLLDGKIDQFPAFEAYATINDGAGVTLFRKPPPPGNTVMNLPRGANRRIRYMLRDTDGSCRFNECTRI